MLQLIETNLVEVFAEVANKWKKKEYQLNRNTETNVV